MHQCHSKWCAGGVVVGAAVTGRDASVLCWLVKYISRISLFILFYFSQVTVVYSCLYSTTIAAAATNSFIHLDSQHRAAVQQLCVDQTNGS